MRARSSRAGPDRLPGPRRSARWWRSVSTFLWRIALPALLILAVVTFAALPEAETLSNASINTEEVRFRVLDPGKAAFRVARMRLQASGTPIDGRCVTGLVTPVRGAIVTYGRVGTGPLEIHLDGPRGSSPQAKVGDYSPEVTTGDAGGRPIILTAPVYAALDGTCPDAQQARLPIWGFATFGTEFTPANGPGLPEPSMLFKGSVKVAARSRGLHHLLYDVTELSLPVGSRLTTPDPCRPGNGSEERGCVEPSDGERGIWWGTVVPDQSGGLQADAATISPLLRLYHPLRKDPDEISVSKLTQLRNDPDLLQAQFYLVVCASIVSAMAALATHFGKLGGRP